MEKSIRRVGGLIQFKFLAMNIMPKTIGGGAGGRGGLLKSEFLEPLINNSIHRTRTIGTTTKTIVTTTTTRTTVTTTKDRFKQNLDSWNPYNKLNFGTCTKNSTQTVELWNPSK